MKRSKYNDLYSNVLQPIKIRLDKNKVKLVNHNLIRVSKSDLRLKRILVLSILNNFTGKQLGIISYLVKSANKTGAIKTTTSKLHKVTNCGYATVANTLRNLYKHGFINKRTPQNNLIQFKPQIFNSANGIFVDFRIRQNKNTKSKNDNHTASKSGKKSTAIYLYTKKGWTKSKITKHIHKSKSLVCKWTKGLKRAK